MPIADSSAPMVVGARHTNNATNEVTVSYTHLDVYKRQVLLLVIIVLIGALSLLPAFALGPLAEQFRGAF